MNTLHVVPRKALNEPCNQANECADNLVCVESKCRTTQMADCIGGDNNACVEVATGSDDDDTKRDYLRRGCVRGHTTSCGELGDLQNAAGEKAEAYESYVQACGQACSEERCRYCFNAAVFAPTDAKKITHARTACDGDHLDGCLLLGVTLFSADDIRPDERKEAILALEKACNDGNAKSCELLDLEGVYPSFYLFADGSTRSSTSLDEELIPFILRCFHLSASYERYTVHGTRNGDTFDLTAQVEWSGLANDYTTTLRLEGRYGDLRVRVTSDDAWMPAYQSCGLTDWTPHDEVVEVINKALREQRAQAAETGLTIGKGIYDLLSD